jgi:WD40 repeat protein
MFALAARAPGAAFGFPAVLWLVLAGVAAAQRGPIPREVPADPDGPPLPDGAVARLGSPRLRHPGPIYSVAYSQDGRWVATAGARGDGTARVWDARTGALRYRFPIPGHLMGQPRVAFVEGGKVLWVLPDRYAAPRDIKRYALGDGKELPSVLPEVPGNGPGFSAGFDPAGGVVAYTRYGPTLTDASEVTLIDAATGKQLARFAGRGAWSMEPVLAPGGRVVACSSSPARDGDGKVRLVRADGGAEVATFDTGGPVQATAFSPDGRLVATSSDGPPDKAAAASIWDAATGKLVRRLDGRGSGGSVAFSPDGKTVAVASAGGNGPVLLFDVATGREARRLASDPTVTEVAFSPDGSRLVASRSVGTVSVWDAATGEVVRPSAAPSLLYPDRFVGPDRILFDLDGAAVYDWRTGRAVERSAAPKRDQPWDIRRCVASPDRALLAEWREDRVVRLTDFKTGAEVRRLEGHTGPVAGVRFAGDGARLYSLGDDGTLRTWDPATGRQVGRLDLGAGDDMRTFHLSPGERWLAVTLGTPGGPVLRVWDLRAGAAVAPPTPPGRILHATAFSADGTALAVAAASWSPYFPGPNPGPGRVIVWDLTTRSARRQWDVPGGALTAAFSADGRVLLTGGCDGTVRVWEVATGTERRAFRGHDGGVFGVLASPDGRHLASGGADGMTYVWDGYGGAAGGTAGPDRAWADLAAADGGKAFAAIRRLVTRADDAVAAVRDRLRPEPAADPDRVRRLVKALDSDRFAVREQAAVDLGRLGREVEPALRRELDEGSGSAEARARLAGLLERMPGPTPEELREERLVEALERIGTPAAVELLNSWARDGKLRIAPAAAAAVKRLGKG